MTEEDGPDALQEYLAIMFDIELDPETVIEGIFQKEFWEAFAPDVDLEQLPVKK